MNGAQTHPRPFCPMTPAIFTGSEGGDAFDKGERVIFRCLRNGHADGPRKADGRGHAKGGRMDEGEEFKHIERLNAVHAETLAGIGCMADEDAIFVEDAFCGVMREPLHLPIRIQQKPLPRIHIDGRNIRDFEDFGLAGRHLC